ncbi:multivesicular body subunit 12A isoform X2 [Belonocnema kinseyi]|uniref:multivesicular body subunit 12A isoform X2 n=1 Tax=Belonocnema kinseyi TaxID=2817044 RepID=UPI00143DF6AF|nr:multivesicular body subunit 12A isoform X2 [Belonocnema kinseyi]
MMVRNKKMKLECSSNFQQPRSSAGSKMSKKDGSKMLVHQLSSVLPDDRPITAISIVEDIDKCPPNFTVVSRTHDLDADADLWRESGLFIKKKTRYICFSKTEGLPHCIVEEIAIIDDREPAPKGYSMISHTVDSMQRAWRKRQLCYKIRNKDLCSKAITDIIICSRVGKPSRRAPFEFTYAGLVNGVSICYKTVDINAEDPSSRPYANIESFSNPSPNPSNGTPHRVAPERPPKPKITPKLPNSIYPQINQPSPGRPADDSCDRDYEILSPNARIIKPTRPAPRPPKSPLTCSTQNYGTLPGSSDLDGVPFALNPLLSTNNSFAKTKLPVIKLRTREELDRVYNYDFRAERET